MRNSDLMVRIGGGMELLAVLLNLFLAFIWFLSLILVFVGVLWAAVGLLALVELGLAIWFIAKGYTKIAPLGPVIGMFVSLCNFNFMGGMLEMFALVLMIAAIVMRGNEDAAAPPAG